LGKIDNSRNKERIKNVEVKLERVIKLASNTFHVTPNSGINSSYDIKLKETLYSEKYEGIGSRDYDRGFDRKFSLNLEKVFGNKGNTDIKQSKSQMTNIQALE
jgi:hypothetical protein